MEEIVSLYGSDPQPGGLVLTRAEIVALTGKKRYKAQARELIALGIPHLTRSDGSVVVFRTQVGGAPTEEQKPEPQMRPFGPRVLPPPARAAKRKVDR